MPGLQYIHFISATMPPKKGANVKNGNRKAKETETISLADELRAEKGKPAGSSLTLVSPGLHEPVSENVCNRLYYIYIYMYNHLYNLTNTIKRGYFGLKLTLTIVVRCIKACHLIPYQTFNTMVDIMVRLLNSNMSIIVMEQFL